MNVSEIIGGDVVFLEDGEDAVSSVHNGTNERITSSLTKLFDVDLITAGAWLPFKHYAQMLTDTTE